ncbi:MAG: RimK family alpha-L-glutamate ligase [Lachnospiraceae bacterium]|jgi:RimK family alpha-L-glutamate ligase|nr:RimK family alpha-L-glutamate ligase [Lachnospiraceae bacterium]MEE3461603.1 RimK family alpha-L-glutamate ligase [Lachnospiraceae bacterium]
MKPGIGIIIYNKFLNTRKFSEHVACLLDACRKKGIDAKAYGNDFFMPAFIDGRLRFSDMAEEVLLKSDFVICFDKDIRTGRALESFKKPLRIFNTISSIAWSDDKAMTYLKLLNNWKDERLPVIDTFILPMTYENIGYTDMSFIDDIEDKLHYPVVLKECFGSFGAQVYLVRDREEFTYRIRSCKGRPMIAQRYIEASEGTDIRIEVIGDRAVCAMKRTAPPGDFRSNVTNGGTCEAYKADGSEKALAVSAVRALGLDFGGVDLMFSHGPSAPADTICEINSNAHFVNITECTGVDVCDLIVDHIIRNVT